MHMRVFALITASFPVFFIPILAFFKMFTITEKNTAKTIKNRADRAETDLKRLKLEIKALKEQQRALNAQIKSKNRECAAATVQKDERLAYIIPLNATFAVLHALNPALVKKCCSARFKNCNIRRPLPSLIRDLLSDLAVESLYLFLLKKLPYQAQCILADFLYRRSFDQPPQLKIALQRRIGARAFPYYFSSTMS